jgi:hypothetical protein
MIVTDETKPDSLLGEPDPTPTEPTPATPERFLEALKAGGRAVITVRSKKTGAHVTLCYVAKKKEVDGRGYVSRATIAGRVGLDDADVIFVDDPTLDWEDGKVGTFVLGTGEWKPAKGADPARLWGASKAFAWAHGSFDLDAKAEVFIELSCSFCGKPLTDPVSIERGVGPDCWGRHTGSKSAERS